MKKFTIFILATLMIFALTSCDKGSSSAVDDTSVADQTSEEIPSESPADDVPVSTVPQEPEPVFEYDDSEDASEPAEQFTELTGEFVNVSKTVEEGAITQWPKSMYDVEDGVVVVYVVDEFDNSKVVFQKISAETGKQIYKLTAELKGIFSYIKDVRELENYGESDILISTSLGAYLFDFEDMSTPPKSIEIDLDLQNSVGVLSVQDQQGQLQNLNNYRFDIYVPEEKLVYSTDDGVFVSEIDGTDERKIIEQLEPEAWFDNIDFTEVSGPSNAVYGNPRFMDNGKKIVCDIKDFDVISDSIGFVIIDIESGDSKRVSYYDMNDDFYKAIDWEGLSIPTYVGLEYIDETHMDISHTAGSTLQGNVIRIDNIFDLDTETITDTYYNITGITSDFENIVYNESYKGETGKIRFGDFVTGEEYSDGVRFSEATTSAVAISDEYALVIVTNSERTKAFTILANVIKG